MVRPLFIGSLLVDPPLLQAPMAGYSNYAYRQMIRRLGGVGLPATEMVSARSFLYMSRRASDETMPDRLWGIADEPRPLAVQIWDNDPAALATVARRLVEELRPSVIDINFGCPARDVSEKAQSGSYLLRHPERVGEIVVDVVAACRPVPVTAKIRLGCTRDAINAIDVAQAVEAAGGAAVTVHGRTAADFYRGSADWDEIARIKPHLSRIPLIGNGDLRTPAAVAEAFARYPVDGVMIGRAALGRPWLFAQSAAAIRGEPAPADPTASEQRQLLLTHFQLVVERFGPAKGTVLMRAYACCYGEGRPGARAFRREVVQASMPEEFVAAVERYFPK
ncbi:MAG: tRNA-dihydrouridine synthase [Planctomycetaceae bacterium]|nr:tRNA-dihydrouridine synthase [Planctomycetaceae bacterium]